jgi:hypothetical protein
MALALVAVLAGVGVARLAQAAALTAERLGWRALAPVAAGLAVFGLALLARPDVSLLRGDVARVSAVAANDDGIAEAAQLAGGAHGVLQCGTPVTMWWSVTALAYDLGLDPTAVHDVAAGGRPVVFTNSELPAPAGGRPMADRVDGWSVIGRCPHES